MTIENVDLKYDDMNCVTIPARIFARDDIVLAAAGSLGCLRALYKEAFRNKALNRFVYTVISDTEYATGAAEKKIAAMLDQTLKEKHGAGIILYTSCVEIITKIDFDRLIASQIHNPDHIPVKVFFRGPMAKRTYSIQDELTQLLKEISARKVQTSSPIRSRKMFLPSVIPDFQGISSALQVWNTFNVLLTAGGCDGCFQAPEGLAKSYQLVKTRFNDLEAAMGCETKALSLMEETFKKQAGGRLCCVLSSPVPNLLGFDYDHIMRRLNDQGIETVFLSSDGFHSGSEGISHMYLELVRHFSVIGGEDSFLSDALKKAPLPLTQECDPALSDGLPEQIFNGTNPSDHSCTGELPAQSTTAAIPLAGPLFDVGVIGSHLLAAASREKIHHGLEHLSWDHYEAFVPEDHDIHELGALSHTRCSWITSAEGLEAAQWLEKTFHIPYLAAIPVGMRSMRLWRNWFYRQLGGEQVQMLEIPPAVSAMHTPNTPDKVATAEVYSMHVAADHSTASAGISLSAPCAQHILLIGDPILTDGIRKYLSDRKGMAYIVRAVYAPVSSMETWYRKVLKEADEHTLSESPAPERLSCVCYIRGREQALKLIRAADIILCDPVFQTVLSRSMGSAKVWIPLPDPILSCGLPMHQSEYTIFGKKGAAWLDEQLNQCVNYPGAV